MSQRLDCALGFFSMQMNEEIEKADDYDDKEECDEKNVINK